MHRESQPFLSTASPRGINDETLVVDLTDRAQPAAGEARVFDAYDRIIPGCALEIVAKHAPNRLFAEFQARYRLCFLWWPLEKGPDIWRVMVAKPAPAAAATVAGVMGADHHRLHELWRDFIRSVELCGIDQLRRRAAEFVLGTRRHIEIEEVMLFPLLEAQTGLFSSGPTAVMRSEHRQIEAVLDRLDELTAARDCATSLQVFDGEPDDPSALFSGHDRKEEATLYPFMDRVFSRSEKNELLSVVPAFEI
ncbi:MAG: hemerythrin domain-containing protein [Candidatus Binataceae bacterium]